MFRAMRHRNFRWYWYGRIGQSIGLGMQQFSIAWLVLTLTDDSLSTLGLVVSLQGLPMIAFLVFGGVVTDRLDRRTVLLASQTLLAAILAGIATLALTGLIEVWHLYIFAVLIGMSQGFGIPARLALMRDLVEREDVMDAMALNFVLMNVAFIAGPPLGGALIKWVGFGPTLYVNASLYLVGGALLLLLRGLTRYRQQVSATMVRDLPESLRYVRSSPAVLTIMVLGITIAFFGEPYIHLMPGFAKEELGLDSDSAGVLQSASGFGALTESLVLASLGDFRRKNWLWLGTILLFAVSLFLLAISPWFGLAVVMLFLMGMGDLNFVSLGTALLRLQSPRALLGRVMGLWSIGSVLHVPRGVAHGICR